MSERQNFLLSLYREFGNNAQNAFDFVKKNDSDDSPAAATPVVTTIDNWNPFSVDIMHKEFAELVPRFMFVNNFLMREEDVNALNSDDEKDRLDALADGIYTYLRNVRKGIGDINNVVLQKTEFEAVDLGLPSGTKWSNMNLGADKPAETGFYLTHYDACDYKFGNNWQMPTEDDFVELCDNCDSEWILFDGVHGRMFTSKINGAKVFFPAAGYYNGTTLYYRGTNGYYWASTLHSSTYGRYLYFHSSGVYPRTTTIASTASLFGLFRSLPEPMHSFPPTATSGHTGGKETTYGFWIKFQIRTNCITPKIQLVWKEKITKSKSWL